VDFVAVNDIVTVMPDVVSDITPPPGIPSFLYFFFFKFNVSFQASLRAPQLIPRALKLMTM
jgi:hypothetical protein